MSNKKAVFNPQAGKQAQKEKVRKETRVSSLVQIIRAIFRKKEKEPENSRTIRFSPRSAKSIYSMVFFLLFFLISLFLLMSFGRLNTLTRLAMQKQVNREEIIESVNKGVAASDQLKYDGMKLVDRLFTVSSKLEGKEYWEAQITPYLATGLRAEDLGLDKTNDDRVARNVRFIRLETVDYKESLYSLYYDVRFTEGKEWRQVQVILPVSYAENELKLLDRPTLMNLAKTSESNKVAYDEQRFIPKGKEV
ncbi:conjugal transfer protein, partial [Enterococcus faecalis]|uniref:conjugal transfer protein n=2 Tax=Enterococcus TaxID=1350 RepID=UPI002072FF1B